MHLNATYKNSWNRKENKVCVTLDSELRKPLLTYATSGNAVGGFGEFGERCLHISDICCRKCWH